MLILSLFSLVPSKQVKNVAAADQVIVPYSFVGSNICVPASTFSTSGSYDLTTILNVILSFTYENGSFTARIQGSYIRKDLASSKSIDTTANIPYNNRVDVNCPIITDTGYKFIVSLDTGEKMITNNIVRVSFGNYYDNDYFYNYITYFDNEDNYLSFIFRFVHNYTNSVVYYPFCFSNRTYYLNLSTIDDNTFYQNGYTNGYNAGLSDGSSSGYNQGYSAGQTIGYDNGYSAGLVAGGDHTFMSLIGAVIDAPVSAFTSLLNFEILGVNLLGFITGLLTLAIIVFIIKLCMGGK